MGRPGARGSRRTGAVAVQCSRWRWRARDVLIAAGSTTLAAACAGKTTQERLGGGDPSQAFQFLSQQARRAPPAPPGAGRLGWWPTARSGAARSSTSRSCRTSSWPTRSRPRAWSSWTSRPTRRSRRLQRRAAPAGGAGRPGRRGVDPPGEPLRLEPGRAGRRTRGRSWPSRSSPATWPTASSSTRPAPCSGCSRAGTVNPNSGVDNAGCPPGTPGADEAARYTGVQDKRRRASRAPQFYDPDDPDRRLRGLARAGRG